MIFFRGEEFIVLLSIAQQEDVKNPEHIFNAEMVTLSQTPLFEMVSFLIKELTFHTVVFCSPLPTTTANSGQT